MSEQIQKLIAANEEAAQAVKDIHARVQEIQQEIADATAERDLQYAAIIAKTQPPAGEGSDG